MTGAANVLPLELELEAGGRRRRALAVHPDGAGPWPVVVMFHGAGATAALALQNTGWGAAALAHGFLALFPEGTPPHADRPPQFRQNPQAWNDGSGRGHVPRSGVDDLAFTAALLDEAARRWPVDERRVHLTGFSNGAAMAFRAGIELAGRVSAVAPVAGHLWSEPATLARPVSLCHVFGAADPLNPIAGGEVATPWGRTEFHPPARRSVARWTRALGCSAPTLVERDGADDGVRVEVTSGCAGGAEVRYVEVADLGHVWPGGARLLPEKIGGRASDRLRGTEYLWEFFRNIGR
jgi:polyhydroxybutyrate depolymerase